MCCEGCKFSYPAEDTWSGAVVSYFCKKYKAEYEVCDVGFCSPDYCCEDYEKKD